MLKPRRLLALLCSLLAVAALTSSLTPSAEAGTSPVNGRYLSYAYLAVSRSGAAVYVNGLVHQNSRAGLTRSPGRAVYLQRKLPTGWQNVLMRRTDSAGRMSVGYLSAPSFAYRLIVLPTATQWGARSAEGSSPALGGVLGPGQSLDSASYAGSSLYSPTHGLQLMAEGGGQFILMQNVYFAAPAYTTGASVWAISGAPYPPATDRTRMTMQANGNLVLTSSAHRVLWSTNTRGAGNALYVQDDGNMVIYDRLSRALWSSGTTKVMLPAGTVIPAGSTYLNKAYAQFSGPNSVGRLTMQRDGNLVLFGGAKAVWSSNTHVPGSHAAFNAVGILGVYSPRNQLLWHTASYGQYSTMQVMCGQLEFMPYPLSHRSREYLPSWKVPASCG